MVNVKTDKLAVFCLAYRCRIWDEDCRTGRCKAAVERISAKCTSKLLVLAAGKNHSEKSEKSFSIIVLHGILNTEMNDMQNRILCVKCSVNGGLSLKRKVRLTVYYPHPLQTI